MDRLTGIDIGDRVRMYGARFAMGYMDGVIVREKDRMYDVQLDDPQSPKALLYDTVGSSHVVVHGVIHHLSSVERLGVAA